MSMQKQMKKGMQSALGLTTTGLTLGMGATVLQPLSKAGGVDVGGGVSAFSKFMPAMGSIAGAGMAIGMLNEMIPKEKKRRRK
jgi:hypothetical protein